MKKLTLKSGLAAMAIAAGFTLSPLAFAADSSQLIGQDLDQNRDLLNSVMQGRNYMVQVDPQGKIKQIVDTGANGDGSDALQLADNAAGANATTSGASLAVPVNYQGQYAIDYMGADLPKIAANYGLTPDKLKEMLLGDDTARIDSNNRIFYIDHTADQEGQQSGTQPNSAGGATPTAASNPPLPIASAAAQANAFKLHSKPGATKTIYLDFIGYSVSNTAWSAGSINATPYDLSGNPSIFDSNELTNIISIWNRVSEDYIPFDVDVTTEPPANDAIIRSSAADNTYGTRVVIAKNDLFNCGCGGIAYVGVVSMVNNTYYQPAWVFQNSLASNEKYIAEAVSHEAGHTLGLIHDGLKGGSAYYFGHGSSTSSTGWAPIMGAGYYENVTQWDHGVYPNSNNQQDDIATFAANGILPRTDDVGNTIATASSLTNAGTGATANIQTFGVIETSSDVDMYLVNTAGGVVNLSVTPAAKGPNLDVQLTLYKANGTVVASNAPNDSLSASISATVAQGSYYLAVSGSGRTAVGTDYGYPTYGSLGQYAITGSYATAGNAVAPVAAITASAVTGNAPFNVTFSANNSVGNGNIVAYQWSFGDNTTSTSSNPVHSYTAVGTYTVSLTVTNQYMLTNTQTMQITVTAPPAAPSLHAGSITMAVYKSSTVTSQIAITVVDAKGVPVPNATVSGTWSGVFSGSASIKTGASGSALFTSNTVATPKTGGSAIFTITGISAANYTYNPTLNVRSVVTLSW